MQRYRKQVMSSRFMLVICIHYIAVNNTQVQLFCDDSTDPNGDNWIVGGAGTVTFASEHTACDTGDRPCIQFVSNCFIESSNPIDATNYHSLHLTYELDLQAYNGNTDTFKAEVSYDNGTTYQIVQLDTNKDIMPRDIALDQSYDGSNAIKFRFISDDVTELGDHAFIDDICLYGLLSPPSTNFPTTIFPTTNIPTTSIPTTFSPTTNAPTTNAPTTSIPTTSVPTTTAPTNNQQTLHMPSSAPIVFHEGSVNTKIFSTDYTDMSNDNLQQASFLEDISNVIILVLSALIFSIICFFVFFCIHKRHKTKHKQTVTSNINVHNNIELQMDNVIKNNGTEPLSDSATTDDNEMYNNTNMLLTPQDDENILTPQNVNDENMLTPQKNQRFYAKAIMDYIANDEDQLNIQENGIFYILEIVESGWWYGINEVGIDGWIPSNYLRKCDSKETQQLIKQQKNNKTNIGDLLDYKNKDNYLGNFDKYLNIVLPPKVSPVQGNITTNDHSSSAPSDTDVANKTVTGTGL
eukprot:434953_1